MRFNTLEGWLEWQEQLHPAEIELGLERVGAVWSNLSGGRDKPFTITVAGTNGKGSTATFLESILISAGYRVGCYSSPHLVCYNERVRLQAEPVSDSQLCGAFEEIDCAREETSLSYFEFGTLAALQIFSRAEVDIQILEVGLGGRLDATNIIDADISVITSIGIDHCEWLGETREEIGFEKAGIFRPLKPAISGVSDLPVTVAKQAEKLGALLKQLGVDFNYSFQEHCWSWASASQQLEMLPLLKMKGEQQFRNASVALAVIEQLPSALPVDAEAIREGLASATLPGRVQWLDSEQKVLLDVSHNPESAKVLAQYLEKRESKGSVFALFSFMSDKDIEAILAVMSPVVDHWCWIPLGDIERAADREQIKTAFTHCNLSQPDCCYANLKEGLSAIWQQIGADDCIVIFGSFYLACKTLELMDSADDWFGQALSQV